MKGQLLIAESKEDFNNGAAQHLIGTKAIGTFYSERYFTLVRSFSTLSQMVVLVSIFLLMTSSSLLWARSVIINIRGICYCHF
jgi:hypothetical protein